MEIFLSQQQSIEINIIIPTNYFTILKYHGTRCININICKQPFLSICVLFLLSINKYNHIQLLEEFLCESVLVGDTIEAECSQSCSDWCHPRLTSNL